MKIIIPKSPIIAKRAVLIIGLWLSILSLFSQKTSFVDSLKQNLSHHNDTTDALTAFEIVKYYNYYEISFDSIQKYAKLGLKYSQQYNWQKGEATYHFAMGQAYWHDQKYAPALVSFKKAKPLLENINDKKALVHLLNSLGAVHLELHDLTVANDYFLQAIRIGEEIGLKKELSTFYSNMSIISTRMRALDDAIRHNKKALEYSAQLSDRWDTLSLIPTLINLSSNFKNNGMIDSARAYLGQALFYAKATNYKLGKKRAIYNALGIEYSAKNYSKVLNLTDTLNTLINEEPTPTNNELKSGIHYYKSLAYHQKQQHQLAKKHAQQSLRLATTCSIGNQLNAYHALIQAHKGNMEYDKAFVYQEQYNELQDSMTAQLNEERVQSLQALYETEKKERALEDLNQQASAQAFKIKQRNLLIGALILVLLLSISSLYLYNQQRLIKQKQAINAIEQKILRLQMNPHFLFNALSSIQTYLLTKEDTPKAIYYLSRFAELMRQVLEYSQETQITLEDEINTLENYLSLQQLRFNNEFKYEIIVGENINRWETLIPPLIGQPFVENAIEHGKVHTVSNGYIKVKFEKKGTQLYAIVEDNGIGRKKALQTKSKSKHTSLATKITKERIRLLSKLAKQKFAFEIKDLTQSGTQVIFKLPLQTDI